ncbi:hypothetical protein EMCRGX_G030680 [Ephydatia muelleri]
MDVVLPNLYALMTQHGIGVGGIEAEAVMLGQTISMVLPEVVGYKLIGAVGPLVTSTDVVLTITKHLRQVGVVNKFVEFFGPGVSQLSIADRATIANMCPEYGATVGFFPVDDMSLKYLHQTGRDAQKVKAIELYLKAAGLYRHFSDADEDPTFSQVVELDLSKVVPSISEPKRPQDRVNVSDMKEDFRMCLENKVGFKGFAIEPSKQKDSVPFEYEGKKYTLRHGSVKAVEKGLTVAPYIKTSLSPGSGVVTYYLKESGVIPALEQLGFNLVGYGSYAIAGTVDIDFEKEPLGMDPSGQPVFLRDIWPSREELQEVERKHVLPAMFKEVYAKITQGNNSWNELQAPVSQLYPWSESSTYIKSPPFFDNMHT